MSQIDNNNPIDYSTFTFSRDTKIDYEKGNPVINSLFTIWDKDKNGQFDDKEWSNYQQSMERINALKEKTNDPTIEHYNKQLEKINKNFQTILLRYESIKKFDYINQLFEFENAHPEIIRKGYKNNSEIPAGAMTIDISDWEAGIYDEKEGKFTGETYNNGYIAGLENLSDEDRTAYLELLKNAQNMMHQIRQINKDFTKIFEETEKNEALLMMAENGLINSYGNEQYESIAYMKYQRINSPQNPFFSEIEQCKQSIITLENKNDRTPEENNQIEQYRIHLEQLRQASINWLASDKNNIPANGNGFTITQLDEGLTLKSSNGASLLSNTQTIGMKWDNGTWAVSGRYTGTQTDKLSKKDKYTENNPMTQESVNITQLAISGKYSKGGLSVSNDFNMMISSMKNYNNRLSLFWNNLSFGMSESVSQMNIPSFNENGEQINRTRTSYSTSLDSSIQTGHINNRVSLDINPEGTTFGQTTQANYSFNAGHHNFNIGSSVGNQYNYQNETWTLNSGISAGWNAYSQSGWRGGINFNENYTRTMSQYKTPQENNMILINSNIGYKNVMFTGAINDMNSPYMHSTTFGAGISYNNPSLGTISTNYTFQHSNNKFQDGGNPTDTNTFTISYSAPLEKINKWFK